MNKTTFFIIGILIIPTTLHASCTKLSGRPSNSDIRQINTQKDIGSCSPDVTYYKGDGSGGVYSLLSCRSCGTGLIQSTKQTQYQDGECGTLSYKACNCPSSCTTTEWTKHSAGYQKRNVCNASTNCQTRTEYRCASGYYGTSTDGSSGCSKCPLWAPGSDTPKTDPGSTEKTSCYITTFGNISGNGVYTGTGGRCYWTN